MSLTKMQSEKSLRMDTRELKAQLLKKVGPERFRRYFYCLNRFINHKLSKSEFDKSCYRILGRENLPLHNQIIRAILKNVCSSNTPPPPVREPGPAKLATPPLPIPVAPIWSNGVVLPMSTQKVRSRIHDRKLRDRPSPLCPNGKTDSASHQSTATEDFNGDLTPCDHQRALIIKKPEDIAGHNIAVVVEDGEEVEQGTNLKLSRSPLVAPLGIPFCSASNGGARKALPVTHTGAYLSYFDAYGLSDSETLKNRMEQIAVEHGVGGVTLECANTLNNMLDVYLKRLIRSSVELVGARSTSDDTPKQKQQILSKGINGIWPSNHLHMQSGGIGEEQKNQKIISLHDFKVAMELNPQQLGEDWPLLLEKISTQSFEE